MPLRLISTDFDGTIFAEFENPPVAAAFQELVAGLQAEGARWVINTGRDMSSLMEALGRARLGIEPDFLVLVEREIFAHEDSRYVPLADWNDRCARQHAELFARVRPDVPRLAAWINARCHATIYEDPFSPLCVIAGDNGHADVICAHLEAYCREVPGLVVVRNDVYMRFSHAAFNKGSALAEIARRLDVPPAGVFAAGDHLNDLPMLTRRHAAWLAAPANAMPATKAQVLAEGGRVSALPYSAGVAEALALAAASAPAGAGGPADVAR